MTLAHEKTSALHLVKQVMISLDEAGKCLKPFTRDPPMTPGKKGKANWEASGRSIPLPPEAQDPKMKEISEDFALSASSTMVTNSEHIQPSAPSGSTSDRLKLGEQAAVITTAHADPPMGDAGASMIPVAVTFFRPTARTWTLGRLKLLMKKLIAAQAWARGLKWKIPALQVPCTLLLLLSFLLSLPLVMDSIPHMSISCINCNSLKMSSTGTLYHKLKLYGITVSKLILFYKVILG